MDALAFFPLALLMALTPGPNNFCALHHGIRHGVAAALIGTLGRAAAFAIFLAISAVGLGAMLLASETAFTVVKWVGAAYLIALGVRAWRQATSDSGSAAVSEAHPEQAMPAGWTLPAGGDVGSTGRAPWGSWMRREFLVGISNPKAIVLFAAVFPQFIDPALPAAAQFMALGATYLAAEFVASTVYALGGLQLRRFMTTAKGARRVGQATGGVFVGAGALLLTAHR